MAGSSRARSLENGVQPSCCLLKICTLIMNIHCYIINSQEAGVVRSEVVALFPMQLVFPAPNKPLG